MATSSFTKNFKIKSEDTKKFVNVLSAKNTSEMLSNFKSEYAHPKRDEELLKKALGK